MGNVGGVVFALIFRFQPAPFGKAFWISGIVAAVRSVAFSLPIRTDDTYCGGLTVSKCTDCWYSITQTLKVSWGGSQWTLIIPNSARQANVDTVLQMHGFLGHEGCDKNTRLTSSICLNDHTYKLQ